LIIESFMIVFPVFDIFKKNLLMLKKILFFFTKNNKYRTVFINKMINLWIMRMFIFSFIIFIFIYSILLAKCYAFAQKTMLGLVWEIFSFILKILFFFYLIIWWKIGIASKSKLEVFKDGWFNYCNCLYYFMLLWLIILFHYSNIPYMGV
jgi:hypothetical protein